MKPYLVTGEAAHTRLPLLSLSLVLLLGHVERIVVRADDKPDELAAVELFVSTPNDLYGCRWITVILIELATRVIPFKYAHVQTNLAAKGLQSVGIVKLKIIRVGVEAHVVRPLGFDAIPQIIRQLSHVAIQHKLACQLINSGTTWIEVTTGATERISSAQRNSYVRQLLLGQTSERHSIPVKGVKRTLRRIEVTTVNVGHSLYVVRLRCPNSTPYLGQQAAYARLLPVT